MRDTSKWFKSHSGPPVATAWATQVNSSCGVLGWIVPLAFIRAILACDGQRCFSRKPRAVNLYLDGGNIDVVQIHRGPMASHGPCDVRFQVIGVGGNKAGQNVRGRHGPLYHARRPVSRPASVEWGCGHPADHLGGSHGGINRQPCYARSSAHGRSGYGHHGAPTKQCACG